MKCLAIFLFLAPTVLAQQHLTAVPHGKPLMESLPEPVLVSKPVEHWSCPKGYVIPANAEIPACRPVTPNFTAIHGYDPEKLEEIHWDLVMVVPRDGIVDVHMPAGFARIPGCSITDKTNEKSVVLVGDVTMSGFRMQATPGHKLHLNCQGFVSRTEKVLGVGS